MPNNIAVSITADVADLTAKLAIARVDVAATSKTLNELAKTASTGDITAELKTSLLAAGDAAAKARAQSALYTRELKSVAPAAASAAHGSAGVTRELLVMGRELSRGNFNRMAGSATILAGRLGVLTPAVIGVAAAAALIAAPFIAFGVATEQGSRELAKFQNSMEATNGYAGVTISQVQKMSVTMAQWAHVGIGSAQEELMKLAGSGKVTGSALLLLGEDATRMAALTGENADKFNEQFEKMSAGVAKFAREYQDQYHQLTTAQYEYIRQLEEQGHKEQAEQQLAKDLYDYLGKEAPVNLGYLETAWHGVESAISDAWGKLKSFGRDSNQDQINSLKDRITALKNGSGSGYSTGLDSQTEINAAEKQLKTVQDREAAEQRTAKGRADQARIQTTGVDAATKLSARFEESKTSGEKLKTTLAQINDEMNKAITADPGGKSRYENEAAAARAQAIKSDTPKAPKAPKTKDNTVQQWTEQLRAQEIASSNFYRDATADELKFWQSKIGLTAAGSKDWLEVQSKIFEASKTLARQAYQDQIASLNEKIASDRNAWDKEQADWQAKLAYIRSTFGEQSAEYKNAYREMERAQQEHDAKELRETEQSIKKNTDELKKGFDAQAKARESDARAAETMAKLNSGNSPLGEVSSAVQIGQIHKQVTEQKIADNQALYASTTATLDTAIAAADAKYSHDKSMYQGLIDAKREADERYADQKMELDATLRQESMQDILAIQQAYRGYVSGVVSSSVTAFDGLISGQKRWAQVGVGIYQSVVHAAESQIAKSVTHMIAGEMAKTSATTAGVAAQISATAAGTAAKSRIVGLANMKEITSHAATAAAAAYHAMAGIPVIGPVLGAAAAAVTFTAVEAYGALASFDKGTNALPNDMIAQVHSGERIVPKADNAKLLELTARGAGQGSAAASGDTHIHYSPTVNGQAPFPDQLAAHEDNIISIMQRAARRGVRFA